MNYVQQPFVYGNSFGYVPPYQQPVVPSPQFQQPMMQVPLFQQPLLPINNSHHKFHLHDLE